MAARIEPLFTSTQETARASAETLLASLNTTVTLWWLRPTNFSGGAQQRVNVARGCSRAYPAMQLEEHMASVGATNREVALELILEAKSCGAVIVGIFDDEAARA
ncbi:MAG: hypothetical protein AAF665_05950 [Pseudomonadota bacterium]